MLNTAGIEVGVKNIAERLVVLVKGTEVLPNTIDAFSIFFGSHFTNEDCDVLDQLEDLNGEEVCNVWLADLLVSTGRYSHAGKGFVIIKEDGDDSNVEPLLEAVV